MKGKDLAIKTDKACLTAGSAAVPVDGASESPVTKGHLPVALLFPGQGSQYVKMLAGVKDLPAVQALLPDANEILGYDLLDLCITGPEEKLAETKYCQPAIFLAGIAGVEKLRSENPECVERAKVLAGLSLGEYTALCVAGVMSFQDGLRLVKLRGEAMQEAASIGSQAMLSVVGLERTMLEDLCREALAAEEGAVCQIANCLFTNGFAVGGTEAAVHRLKSAAESAGALQCKLLKTSGAFHTPLMKPAQDRLSAALDELLPTMQPPRYTVWMNATAEPVRPGTSPAVIVENLKSQLTSPVLWDTSCMAMIEDGVTDFFEVGPMKQVKAMMKRINMNAWKKMVNVEV